jgi:hypothetical protein
MRNEPLEPFIGAMKDCGLTAAAEIRGLRRLMIRPMVNGRYQMVINMEDE